MKNLAKTVFAAAIAVAVLTSSATSNFAAEKVATETTTFSVKSANRIWVSGNVKIVLTKGDKQSVVATENYDASKTSVLSNGQTLYINSLESTQVTLNITMKDLERIEAYGNAVVVTTNNFDVKNLQLFLSHSATAKVRTTTKSLYTVVKDDAVLKLNGTSNQSTMIASNMKNVRLSDFASLKSESYASEAIMKGEQTAMTVSK
jgi:hypothetical protein